VKSPKFAHLSSFRLRRILNDTRASREKKNVAYSILLQRRLRRG
jgi:hypothetical protein